MDPTTMKYISIVSAVIFGSVLIFGLLYKVSQMDDTVSKKSKKYKKSKSLDKLYDEAGGNDPLSDARMTTEIDLSTQDYSCGFLVTHKGVRDRSVDCISGCSERDVKPKDDDDNSNFCKQFVYGSELLDDGLKKNTLLDETFIKRRDAAKK